MAVKIGWTQNAWTFGEPNPWRFYQSLGGHGWMKARTRRWSIFEAVYVINVPLKPKFLTSIQAVWWFLYNMHAFLQLFFDNIITHTHSLYSQMCVFSHWIPFPFPFLLHLFIHVSSIRLQESWACSRASGVQSCFRFTKSSFGRLARTSFAVVVEKHMAKQSPPWFLFFFPFGG